MGRLVFGIRREDKSVWERRVALTPGDVGKLVKSGVKFLVQPSSLRVFSDAQYEKAGAVLKEDIGEADIIVGLKEIGMEYLPLYEKKTAFFFSHVIKAQSYNMQMLDSCLEKKINIIDYECIAKKTERGRERMVKFGWYAGAAGAINMMYSFGERLVALGFSTPFLHMPRCQMLPNLEAAKTALRVLGKDIEENGLPGELCPMIFCVVGDGAVGHGSWDMLECLPHEDVGVQDLARIAKESKERHKIFRCMLGPQHTTRRTDGGEFDLQHFISNPDKYENVFNSQVAPYVSMIFNGVFWTEKFPRLLTTAELKQLHEEKNLRLLGLCDISCDIGGSLEFMGQETDIDNPDFVYDICTGKSYAGTQFGSSTSSHDSSGILISSVSILPTMLAEDASRHFSDNLFPLLAEFGKVDSVDCSFDELDIAPELKEAIIAWNGQLTPRFKYIEKLRSDT